MPNEVIEPPEAAAWAKIRSLYGDDEFGPSYPITWKNWMTTIG